MSVKDLQAEIKTHGAAAQREMQLLVEKNEYVALLRRLRLGN